MGLWSTRSGISVNYSYSSSPTFTAEPWSVHTGRPRSSSSGSSRVSVFIFDKRKFENYLLNYGVIQSRSSSADRQLISDAYDILRTQVNNMAKLKHPMLLGLVAPLEEHSKSFMFVTEYVSGCLLSIYQGHDSDQDLFSTESQDIIIQRGILQISHGLDFIHNTASSVHLDLNPRTVFVNEHSDWKVFGLGHLFKLAAGTNTAEYFMPQYDSRVPSFMQLDLNYTAPEIVFENTVSPRSDYFSLGALVYFLYYGRNLFNCDNSTSNYRDEYSRFERKLSQMSWESIFSKLPDKVRATIPRLMSRDLYARYEDINEFIASEFFEDPLIKTLVFLDDLPTKSTEEKTVFLNGLAKLLPKFPAQLLQRKFLTALLQLLDQSSSSNEINSECLSQTLHIIIQIGRSLSQLTFNEKVAPYLTSKHNFDILLKNASMCLISNLETLKEKLKSEVFCEQMLKPLFAHALSSANDSAVELQCSALSKLHVALETLDFTSAKRSFFPLITELFVRTTSLTVKVSCISSFLEMVKRRSIDKFTVLEELLPLVRSMKTRDSRVLVKFLDLFRVLPDFIQDDEAFVQSILPIMWTFSMSKTLSPAQYSEFTEVLNNITQQIQRSHLQALHKNESHQKKTSNFSKVIEKPASPPVEQPPAVATPVLQPKKPARPANKYNLLAKPNGGYGTASSADKPTAKPSGGYGVASSTDKPAVKPLTLSKGMPLGTRRARGSPRIPQPAPQVPEDDFDAFVSSSEHKPSPPKPSAAALPPGFSASLLQPSKRSSTPAAPGT